MRKIMNDPKSFVDDFLDGLLKAYPSDFRVVSGARRALIRVEPPDAGPKVAIVTGGGSGHLPLFLGYVGQGLCSRGGGGQHSFRLPRPTRSLPRQRHRSPERAFYSYMEIQWRRHQLR